MSEWFQVSGNPSGLDWQAMAARLILSALCGFLVAGIYLGSQRRVVATALPLLTTLVLLTILVAMTTIVIGENLARAFGLVGALSIVRFRTVVEVTRDTAFVIFAVVVGMAVGAGYVLVCEVGIPIVALVALALGHYGSPFAASGAERRLEVRVGVGHDPEALLADVVRERLATSRLISVISARQGAAFDLVYAVRLREPQGLLPLVKAIHALEGVQSVEIKEL
jgi:hypothetical protein